MMLTRYRDQTKDAPILTDMVQDMRGKFCRGSAQVQLGANTGRQAGALNLRN